jgi:hypothetical protein
MMNRGLGSIMGYRGGGMPIARFQEGGLQTLKSGNILTLGLEYLNLKLRRLCVKRE